jgi:hypothetical protein
MTITGMVISASVSPPTSALAWHSPIVDRHFDQVGPAVLRRIFFEVKRREHPGRKGNQKGDEDRQHRSLERAPDACDRRIGGVGILEEGPMDPGRQQPGLFQRIDPCAQRAFRAFLGSDVDRAGGGKVEGRFGLEQIGVGLDLAPHFLPRIFADQARPAIAQRFIGGKGDDIRQTRTGDQLIGVGVVQPRCVDGQRGGRKIDRHRDMGVSESAQPVADHDEQQEREKRAGQQHRAQPHKLEAPFGGIAARDAALHRAAFPVGGGGVSIHMLHDIF